MRRNISHYQPRLVIDSPEGPRLVSPRRRHLSGRGLIAVAALAMAAALLLLNGATRQDATVQAAPAGPDTGQVLVKFKPNASQQAIDALNRANAAVQVDEIAAIGVKVLKVGSAQAAAALYAHNPLVEFAEPNGIATTADTTPNDPRFPYQWELSKVQAAKAWDLAKGSSSVTLAVLDTGISPTQEDLAGRISAGYNFVAGTTNTVDDNGHGTSVASIAGAATNNGTAMASVGWQSSLMPVKVCDAGGFCVFSNVANGITWAADHGARIINLSLGASTTCPSTMQSAVNYAWSKGVLLVAAAGNEGAAVDAPANCNNVIAVGATNSSDVRMSWSNFGTGLDLVAPGSGVWCALLSGGYSGCGGTSFSSPMVASAAVLLVSAGANNGSAAAALTSGADDLGTAGWDQYYGFGRLNAYKALLALGSAPAATATPSATATPVSSPTPAPTATATTAPASSPTATATQAPAPVASDTTAPQVSLKSPGQGATAKGNVNLTVNASDNVGVVRVDYYVDGVLYKSSTGAPFSVAWNSRRWANGSHTIVARAYDAAGNSASDSHSITVAN